MSLPSEISTFAEFYRLVNETVAKEPYISRFNELSRAGSRQEMIVLVTGLPCVRNAKFKPSFRAKNDTRARHLYETFTKGMAEKSKVDEGDEACDILTEALFAASANSRVYLDALLERARRSYHAASFLRCLRDCECMLALPAALYNGDADTAKHFLECRKECARLECECARKLETISRRKKKRGKNLRTFGFSKTELSGRCTPKIEGKAHDTLKSCSDAVALMYDQKVGRHLVATRDIKPGCVLIVDRPFSFSTDPLALGRNCLHCHVTLKLEDSVRIPCRNCQTVSFCSEDCRSKAWQRYHKYECSVFNFFFQCNNEQQQRQTSHLLLAYRTTVLKALCQNVAESEGKADDCKDTVDRDFLWCRAFATDEKGQADENITTAFKSLELGPNDTYCPWDYRTVLQLVTHCEDTEPYVNLMRTIEAILLAKCLVLSISQIENEASLLIPLAVAMLHHLQAINCNAYEIIENVRDEETHIWEPRNVGGALYTTVSLVNHGCYPNVVRHSYPGGIVVVRTLRFIKKGTEILDCYGPHFLSESRLVRREFLWTKYRFVCACIACIQNWVFPLPDEVYYKCSVCAESSCMFMIASKQKQETNHCFQCKEKLNLKKLDRQLRKSIKMRINAVENMYQSHYDEALLSLLQHANFVDTFLGSPNIEAIKTQQCIIQCYNAFGCISIKRNDVGQ